MRRSIKHLPKRTQQELEVLVELIKEKVSFCHMIILYGSYARGEHVFWDERIEFGTHTTFQRLLGMHHHNSLLSTCRH